MNSSVSCRSPYSSITLPERIKDNNSSLDARYGAYEQLKKLVPELSDLTLEEAESQGLLNFRSFAVRLGQ